MAETYCGKSCESCARRERLACPGCKVGPGRSWYDGCEIASCCKGKNHETCATCTNHRTCGKLNRRDGMAEHRIRRQIAAAQEKAELARKAPFMGKWLWLLFWLIIPSTVAGLISNDAVVGLLPVLRWPGQILSALCSLAYGLILLKLASEEERYRTAGICSLVTAAVGAVASCFSGNWTLLLTLPAAIVGLVGEYHEFMSHGEALRGIDSGLADKWRTLWKWYIGTFGVMIGDLILILIFPRFGLLVLLAALIGIVVVSILKLVYLYRTAKRFREYSC